MKTVTGNDISVAANWLMHNECVAIPTETVYGLAANALEEDAVLKIYAVKQRPKFNPLILHVAGLAAALQYVSGISSNMRKLAEAFWPGSLTLLLPKSPLVNDLVTAGSQKVALRVPNHTITLQLLEQLKFPLAAPSANPSGYVSPTTAAHVSKQLSGNIPYILDGGECHVGLESTIAGEDANGTVVIHRAGAVTAEMIAAVIGHTPAFVTHAKNDNPEAPGQLKSHYATVTPLYLAETFSDYSAVHDNTVLHLRFKSYLQSVPETQQWLLAPDGSMETAAKNLFRMMREADAAGYKTIIAETLPQVGIGIAVNDRLHRAQHALKGT